MITIYTRTNKIYTKEFLKWFGKKIVGKYTGPDAVLDSLVRGLTTLGISFEVNPFRPKYTIVHVISGITVLQEMITLKQKGLINTLLAGPTLVTTPYDHNNLIQNQHIDLLLFPSNWTKDFYVSLVPALEQKIQIWPAGVNIPTQISSKEKVLVFKKNIPEDIFDKVIKILDNRKIDYDILYYGRYHKKEYYEKLSHASLLIYLQMTESQGLAIQEAWSFDIPTLVWQNKKWQDHSYEWSDPKISAPYLTDESGIFFSLKTLDALLDAIQQYKYHFSPRAYCIEKLSDYASAQKYLEIIKHNVK